MDNHGHKWREIPEIYGSWLELVKMAHHIYHQCENCGLICDRYESRRYYFMTGLNLGNDYCVVSVMLSKMNCSEIQMRKALK